MAQVLRIEAVKWTTPREDQVCMRLEVLGCVAQPGKLVGFT